MKALNRDPLLRVMAKVKQTARLVQSSVDAGASGREEAAGGGGGGGDQDRPSGDAGASGREEATGGGGGGGDQDRPSGDAGASGREEATGEGGGGGDQDRPSGDAGAGDDGDGERNEQDGANSSRGHCQVSYSVYPSILPGLLLHANKPGDADDYIRSLGGCAVDSSAVAPPPAPGDVQMEAAPSPPPYVPFLSAAVNVRQRLDLGKLNPHATVIDRNENLVWQATDCSDCLSCPIRGSFTVVMMSFVDGVGADHSVPMFPTYEHPDRQDPEADKKYQAIAADKATKQRQ